VPNPLTITTDFELAVTIAVNAAFGFRERIHYCFYHLTQATHRYVQTHGVQIECNTPEGMLAHFCGMTDGLAFLPLQLLDEGVAFLAHVAVGSQQVVLNYFVSTYIGDSYG